MKTPKSVWKSIHNVKSLNGDQTPLTHDDEEINDERRPLCPNL